MSTCFVLKPVPALWGGHRGRCGESTKNQWISGQFRLCTGKGSGNLVQREDARKMSLTNIEQQEGRCDCRGREEQGRWPGERSPRGPGSVGVLCRDGEPMLTRQQLLGTWQDLAPGMAQNSDLSREARNAGCVSASVCACKRKGGGGAEHFRYQLEAEEALTQARLRPGAPPTTSGHPLHARQPQG